MIYAVVGNTLSGKSTLVRDLVTATELNRVPLLQLDLSEKEKEMVWIIILSQVKKWIKTILWQKRFLYSI